MNRKTIYAFLAFASLLLPLRGLIACGYNYVSLCATTMNIEVDGVTSGFQISECSYLTSFHNHNFGTVSSLSFADMKSTTWESCNNDVMNARFFYRIYDQTTSPGDFEALDMPQLTTVINGSYRTKSYEGSPNLNVLLGLNPGDYFIEIYLASEVCFNMGNNTVDTIISKNNNGEFYRASFTVSAGEPGSLSLVLTDQTNVSCSGDNDGNATVAASNGTPPYTYLWSNGSSSPSILDVPAGIYGVTATDMDGNTGMFSVVISQPSPLNPNISSVNETSSSANNGSATSTPFGGTPPYSFFWNNGETTNAIENLDSGTYSVTLTDGNGCTAVATTTIIVSGTAPTNYCPAKGDFPWVDWITHVGLNTIDHSSGKSQYSDFTQTATELSTGSSYTISLENSFSWQTFDEYWKVWIDYDRDGNFEEPEEIAFSGIIPAPPSGTGFVVTNGNIIIPASAEEGTTRMRVALKRGAYATPCETIPFGEVEDYTINLAYGGPVVCSISSTVTNIGCNDNGTNTDPDDDLFNFTLTVNGNGTSGYWTTTINEQPFEGPYGVPQVISALPISIGQVIFDIFDSGDSTCIATEQVTAPPSCSNPAPCVISFSNTNPICNDNGTPEDPADDTFSFNLTVNGSNGSAGWNAEIYGETYSGLYSEAESIGPILINQPIQNITILDENDGSCALTFSMSPPSPCSNGTNNGTYCESSSNFPWHDWIAGVALEELENPSGKSPYSDFTGLSVTAVTGASYVIELTSGFSWFTYDEYWKVWIDYDQDGLFEEPEELVVAELVSAPANGTLELTTLGTFSIDNAALTGSTRMRVAMKRGSAPTPCETIPYGEVEDYTINILPASQQLSVDLNGISTQENVDLFVRVKGKIGNKWVLEKSDNSSDFKFISSGIVDHEKAFLIEKIDNQPFDGKNFYRINLYDENDQLLLSSSTTVPFQHVASYDIFPNPASHSFQIKLTDAVGKEVIIEVYNRFGQPVYQGIIPDVTDPMLSIDVKDWPEGLYQVIICPEDRRRLAKQIVIMTSN